MTSTYHIAEAAQLSGFEPSVLRYYEQRGLIRPARTDAGYRVYDDATLIRLAFIARAKRLGCSLNEITTLLTAWDTQQCSATQARLQALLTTKIDDVVGRADELDELVDELRSTSRALEHDVADGPCDMNCSCITAPDEAKSETRDPAIACTLTAAAAGQRVEEWRHALVGAAAPEKIDGGVRLVLDSRASLPSILELAHAEQSCCSFFRFAITIDERGTALEVTGPNGATELMAALFGRHP